MLERVVRQGTHDTSYRTRVARRPDGGIADHLQARGRGDGQGLHRRLDLAGQIDLATDERSAVAIEVRDGEQIDDQGLETVHLPTHGGDHLPQLLTVEVVPAALRRGEQTLEWGERRTQLVRHGGDEV